MYDKPEEIIPTELSAVYAIEDVGGRLYVGSSVDYRKRFRQHILQLRGGTHHCEALQKAYRTLGESNFSLRVIEIVPEKRLLLPREQHWIDTLQPFFNSSKFAGRADQSRSRREDRKIARQRASWHRSRAHSASRSRTAPPDGSMAPAGSGRWPRKQ